MEQQRNLYCHICQIEFQCQDQKVFKCEKCDGDFCEEIYNDINDDPRNFKPYGAEDDNTQLQNNNSNNIDNTLDNINTTTTNNNNENSMSNQNNINNNLNQNTNINGNIVQNGNVIIQQSRSLNNNIQSQTIRIRNNGQPNNIINSLLQGLFPTTGGLQNGSNNNNIISNILNIGGGDFLGGLNNNNEAGDPFIDNIIEMIMRNDPNTYGTPPASEIAMNSLPKVSFKKEAFEQQECFVCKEDFIEKEQLVEMPCCHYFHNDCLIPWLKQHNQCPACRHELPTDNQDYEQQKQNQQSQN